MVEWFHFLVVLGVEQLRYLQLSHLSLAPNEATHTGSPAGLCSVGLLFFTCLFFRKFQYLVIRRQHTDFSFQSKILKIGSVPGRTPPVELHKPTWRLASGETRNEQDHEASGQLVSQSFFL